MTTPRLGAPELTEGQAAPETTVNEQVRYLESASGHFVLEDRDLSTPPGSPSDGQSYLVAGTGTGAWAGHDGDVAYYMNTAWIFINVQEGFTFWVKDENKFLVATSASTFQEFETTAGVASINAQTGTTYTLVLGDANNVVELTNGSAITMTIPPNSSVAFAVGTVIEIHQGGAGTVTVTAGVGVTLLARGGLVDLAGEEAIAAIRKMATDTWRLTGDIA
jgi:hypothetical protein